MVTIISTNNTLFAFDEVMTSFNHRQSSNLSSISSFSSSKEPYLVKIKDNTSSKSSILSLNIDAESKEISKHNNRIWLKTNLNTKQIEKLKNDKNVEQIEKDHLRQIISTPDDSYYNSTGDFQNGLNDQWNLHMINLLPQTQPNIQSSGWDITTGDATTIIAVIDTGIDLTHPDLINNIYTNPNASTDTQYPNNIHGWNFVDNNNNVQDVLGHGTHVSGIIAAQSNNGQGVAGTCWSCKIMPLKVVANTGYAEDSVIAQAIYYATNYGASVINISLGGSGYSQVLQDAVSFAFAHNVLVVSAAGNSGASAQDSYPGGLQDSLSIGSSNYLDQTSSYSNTGGKIDILAPGENILSTKLQTITQGCIGANINYYCLSGTSMSSPHVAGVAGLLYSLHKNDSSWDVKEIRAAILKTATNYISGFTDSSGYGRLDALKTLKSTIFTKDNTPVTVNLNNPIYEYIKGNYQIKGNVNDDDLYLYTITIKQDINNMVVKQISQRNLVVENTIYNLDTTTLSDQKYDIYITAEDFSGNISFSNTILINVNNSSPSNFNLISPTNNINSSTPQFNWMIPSSTSPLSYNLYIDGSLTVSNLTTNFYIPNFNISEGAHSYYVIAKDINNNSAQSSNTLNFTVDTTPPNNFNIGITIDKSSATLTFLTTDDVSGISYYDLSLDNSQFSNQVSPYILNSLSDGNHTVTIRAHDNLNNIRTVTGNFNINSRSIFLISRGDFTKDGKVDLSDLSILAQNWQKNTNIGDANGDNKIDLSDLSILAQNWQKTF